MFGWGWHEFTSDQLGTYSLATKYGRDVAAVMDEKYTARAGGLPRLWRTFFWSDDLESTIARCKESGGKVLREIHEHGDLGRSVECETPEGVSFVVWSGRDSLAGRAPREIGTPHWPEYYTRDAAGAYRFFDDVLGIKMRALILKLDPAEDATYTYHLMSAGDSGEVGGMLEMDESWGDLASHMMVYFAVEDCDATAKLVADNGGRVCVPPTQIPSGRFAVLEDPQGCTFSVLASDPDWQPPTN